MNRIALLLIIIVAGISQTVNGQNLAIKTNLLADGLLNPNLGIEIGLAPRWTTDISGQVNLWRLSHDRQWRHWMLQPEVRYWLCDRFIGHFVGAHVIGGQYNIGGVDIPVNFWGTDFRKLKDYRFQGWFGGAGIAYGYDWAVSQSFNIEAEIGIGWTYTRYDQFKCAGCGKKIKKDHPHNYVGPTKAAINLVYTF